MKVWSIAKAALLVFLVSCGLTQGSWAGQSFAVIGDAGVWNSETRNVQKSIYSQGVQSLILPGDNLYSSGSTYESIWGSWRKLNFEFPVVAIGNHHGGYAAEVQYFNMPGEYYQKSYGGLIKFIVLNSDNKKNVAEQMTWLEQTLQSSTEQFVFLVYHHPSLTISRYHMWTEKRQFQTMIRPLMKKYRSRITGVLNGHDHIATLVNFDDMPVFVSGATHEIRTDSPVNSVQEGVRVQTQWYFNGLTHWLRLNVEAGKASVQLQYVEALRNRVVCTIEVETGLQAKLSPDCKLP